MIWLLTACTFSPGQGFSELASLSVQSTLPSSFRTDQGFEIELSSATLTVGQLTLLAHAPEEEEEDEHAHAEGEDEHEEEEHEDSALVWMEGAAHDWLAGGTLTGGPILPSATLPRAEITHATLALGQLSATGTVRAGPRAGPLTITLDLELEVEGELELLVDEDAPEALVVEGTLEPPTTWLDGIDFQSLSSPGGAVINPTSPQAVSIVAALSQMPLELAWTEADLP